MARTYLFALEDVAGEEQDLQAGRGARDDLAQRGQALGRDTKGDAGTGQDGCEGEWWGRAS
jgi:hypothetical protein